MIASRRDAVRPCRRPLLVGYYGERNLGDDALLQVLLEQLPAGAVPLVTARDQQAVRRRFGVECVDRTSVAAVLGALGRSDVLVFGGGSLLQDATSFASLLYYGLLITAARLLGRPVLLWAQGLGPLRRRRSRLLVRALLPLVSRCSWRDGDSEALAQRLGRRRLVDLVGSDPVWSLVGPPWQGPGGPVVLCFRPTAQLQGERWKPWLAALAELAPERELVWLPFHAGQDRGLLASLNNQGLLPAPLVQRCRELVVEDPAEAMAVFARSGLVLAMRLHGLILAAGAGAPCAALSYDPKVAAAAAALGCDRVALDRPPPPDLAARWRASLDQPPDPARLRVLREQARIHRRLFAPAAGDA